MTKVYRVKAKVTTIYSAYVQVPDSWTKRDVVEWYQYNGSSGEFTEEVENGDWEWISVTTSYYDGTPDMVFTEEEN